MRKILLAIIGIFAFGSSYADGQISSTNTCKPLMEVIKSSFVKVQAAIKANDPDTIGKAMIAEHKYEESFVLQHPECKVTRTPIYTGMSNKSST